MPAAGPPTLEFPARGSRPKTETGETSANHAGRRASNPEIPGPEFAPGNRNQRDEREPCRPPGPPCFHRAHPTSPGPTQKRRAAARRFSLSSYLPIFLSSCPIIYSSGLRSIPSNPSRYAFSSGSTSEMPPSWVASTFSGSTGSCRDFRRRNQPVWPFKS